MIDTISDLPEVIADINKRLANGEMRKTLEAGKTKTPLIAISGVFFALS